MQNRHNSNPQNENRYGNEPQFRRDHVEGQPDYYAQQADRGSQSHSGYSGSNQYGSNQGRGPNQNQGYNASNYQDDLREFQGPQGNYGGQQNPQQFGGGYQGQSGVPSRGYSSTGGQQGSYSGQGGGYGQQGSHYQGQNPGHQGGGGSWGYNNQQSQGSGYNQSQNPNQRYDNYNNAGSLTYNEWQQTQAYGNQGQQGYPGGSQGNQGNRYNQNYNDAGYAGTSRYSQGYSDSGYSQSLGQQGYSNPTGIGSAVMQNRGQAPKSYKRSDERIQEDVYERLTHSGMDCSDLEVSVKSGVVEIKGEIDSRTCKFQAEHIADSVSGVKDITNQIKVNRDRSGDRGQQSRSETQYDSNARTRSSSSDSNIDLGESNRSKHAAGSKS